MTTAAVLKDRFGFYVNQYDLHKMVAEPYFKAALGTISKAAGGDANRKLVMKALTGKTSSKLFTDEEKYALCKFAAPDKIGGHWVSNHGYFLIDMCKILLEDLARQEGQIEFFSESGEPSPADGRD